MTRLTRLTRKLSLALVAIVLLTGCAGVELAEEKTASELIYDGMHKYETGHYRAAIEIFEKLRDWYPFSQHAIKAELHIADAHYQLKAYDEAISAYELFISLHPQNEAVPYVQYQIGRCYFDQIETIDRDQTNTRKAYDTFRQLIRQFPDTDYANRGTAHIKTCLKSLASHELYVAKYYFKAKQYKAALNRFMKVIDAYPDVGTQHVALGYIARCEALIDQPAEEEATQ